MGQLPSLFTPDPVVNKPTDPAVPAPTRLPSLFTPDRDDPLATSLSDPGRAPADAARVLKLQMATGLAPDVIDRHADEIERETNRAGFNAEEFRTKNPIVAEWLIQSPLHASVAKDDLEPLTRLEAAWSLAKRAAWAGVSGLYWGGSAAEYGAAEALVMGHAAALDRLRAFKAEDDAFLLTGKYPDVPTPPTPEMQEAVKPLADWAKNIRQHLTAVQEVKIGRRPDEGFWERTTISAATSLGQMVPGMVTAAGLAYVGQYQAGGRALMSSAALQTLGKQAAIPMLTSMAIQAGGTAGAEGLDAKKDPTSALGYALTVAFVEAATEFVPGSWFVKDLLQNAPLRQVAWNLLWNEVPGELIATATQNLAQWVAINPTKPFMDYLKEQPSALLDTLVSTVMTVGVASGVGGAVSKAASTLAGERLLTDLGKAVKESKTRERSPEAFQALIEKQVAATGRSHFWVPVEALDAYAIEKGLAPAEFAAAVSNDPDAYQHAVSHGLPLEVPYVHYLMNFAASEHGRFFETAARAVDPNIQSRQELDAFITAQAAAISASEAGLSETRVKLESQGVAPDTAADQAQLHDRGLATLQAIVDEGQVVSTPLKAQIVDIVVEPPDAGAPVPGGQATPDVPRGTEGGTAEPVTGEVTPEAVTEPAPGDNTQGGLTATFAYDGPEGPMYTVDGEPDPETNPYGRSTKNVTDLAALGIQLRDRPPAGAPNAAREAAQVAETGRREAQADRERATDTQPSRPTVDRRKAPGRGPGGVERRSTLSPDLEAEAEANAQRNAAEVAAREEEAYEAARELESRAASRARSAAGDGIAASYPRSTETTGRTGKTRVAAETAEQRAAREQLHYASVFAHVLAAARAVDPTVDVQALGAEFFERVSRYRQAQEDERLSSKNPIDLLTTIAAYGGLYEPEGGEQGELADLKSGLKFGTLEGVRGVFRSEVVKNSKGMPITGLSFDLMVTSLQQDERYSWITDRNVLYDFLDDIRRHGVKQDFFPGTAELRSDVNVNTDTKWWDPPWRAIDILEEPVTDALEPGVEEGSTDFNVDELFQAVLGEEDPRLSHAKHLYQVRSGGGRERSVVRMARALMDSGVDLMGMQARRGQSNRPIMPTEAERAAGFKFVERMLDEVEDGQRAAIELAKTATPPDPTGADMTDPEARRPTSAADQQELFQGPPELQPGEAPYAIFKGYNPPIDDIEAEPIYDLVGGPNHGSTVGRAAVEAAGLEVPETPAYDPNDLTNGRGGAGMFEFFQGAKLEEPDGYGPFAQHLTEEERANQDEKAIVNFLEFFKTLPLTADGVTMAFGGRMGRGFYKGSLKAIQQIFGMTDTPRFIAIMASLSPRKDVSDNVLHAVKFWRDWDKDGRPGEGRGASISEHPDEVARIRKHIENATRGKKDKAGDFKSWTDNVIRSVIDPHPENMTLSGPKVQSFARNLLGYLQEVTNDVWMTRVVNVISDVFGGNRTRDTDIPGYLDRPTRKNPAYKAMNAWTRQVAKELTKADASGYKWTPAEAQETMWSWVLTVYQLSKKHRLTPTQVLKQGLITDAAIANAPNVEKLLAGDATIVAILKDAGYGPQLAAFQRVAAAATKRLATRDPRLESRPREGKDPTNSGATVAALRNAARLDQRRIDEKAAGAIKRAVKDTTQDAASWATALRQKIGPALRILTIYDTAAGDIHLERIYVERGSRDQMLATRIMQALVRFADKRGQRLTATPGKKFALYDRTDLARLTEFYERFGFIKNRGVDVDTDLEATMYRPAQALTGATPPAGETLGEDTPTYEPTSTYDADDIIDLGNIDDYLPLPGGPTSRLRDEPAGPADPLQRGIADALKQHSEAFATQTALVTIAMRELGTDLVTSPNDAAQALAYLARGAVERFDAVVTDAAGRPLAVIGGFKGNVTQTSIHMDTLLAEAVRIPGAAHIWAAHNHPSDSSTLSTDDKTSWQSMLATFKDTAIEPMGLMAISSGPEGTRTFQHIDRNRIATGTVAAPGVGRAQAKVPVLEREIVQHGRIGGPILTGRDSEAMVPALAKNQFGVLLLDGQHQPIGFLPMDPDVAVALKAPDGRLMGLLRALSTSGAAASIVHVPTPSAAAVLAGQNLVNALQLYGVSPIDMVAAGKSLLGLGLFRVQEGVFFQDPVMFYSKLQRVVEESKQARASGRDWKGLIKNAKIGINLDEFALTHVDDLDDKEVYSREDVLAYLKAHEITVVEEEIERQGEKAEVDRDDLDARVEAEYDEEFANELENLRDRIEMDFDAGEAEARLVTTTRDEDDPGSEHEEDHEEEWMAYVGDDEVGGPYATEREAQRVADRERESLEDEAREEHDQDLERRAARRVDRDEIEERIREQMEEDLENDEEGTPGELPYQGYQMPNADDHTYREVFLAVPKEVFWGSTAQQIWRDGHDPYADVENPVVRLRFNIRTINDQRILFLEEVQPPSEHWQTKMPALFKKNWREIAFKWALRQAAEQGLAGISWTPGKVQAERYSLEKVVSSIGWEANHPGQQGWAGGARVNVSMMTHAQGWIYTSIQDTDTGMLVAAKPHDRREWAGHTLAEVIGEAAAESILMGEASGTLSGLSLRVGGEGLKRLYDVDFKAVANKLPAVKKHGGRVAPWIMYSPSGWGMLDTTVRSMDIPVLLLTPELRNAVMNGQALFQDPDETKAKKIEHRAALRFQLGERDFVLALYKTHDYSSFIHELGHFFLIAMGDAAEILAARDPEGLTPRQKQLLADYGGLLQWFGVDNTSQITRAHHEQFADGYMVHKQEGQTTDVGLKDLFARFAKFLKEVYPALLRLKVPLTDDVRGIMDRMQASEAAIQGAEAEAAPPLFTTAEAAGMTPARFELYRASIEKQAQKAREKLEAQIEAQAAREQTEAWQSQKDEIRTRIEAEVYAMPVYQALAAIQRGTHPNGEPLVEGMAPVPYRMSKAMLLAEGITEERLRALPRPLPYLKTGGMDPDVVRRAFGYTSVDELLTALEQAPPMRPLIEARVNEAMLRQHGALLLDPEALEAAAAAAVANEDRDVIVRAELRALAALKRVARPFEKAGEAALRAEQKERAYERRWMDAEAKLKLAIQKKAAQVEILALQKEVRELKALARGGAAAIEAALPPQEALREAARVHIAGMKVRALKPAVYLKAANQAAARATAAAARQQLDAAILAKQQELLNLAYYHEAERVQERVEIALRKAKELQTTAARRRLGLAGANYLDQIDGVLDRFSFAPASQKALDRKGAFKKFIQGLESAGMPTDGFPDELLEEAQRTPYQELTTWQFLTVVDGLTQLLHLAQLKNQLLRKQAARTFADERDLLEANIRAKNTAHKIPYELTEMQKKWAKVSNAYAAHAKLSLLTLMLDGGEDGGPAWEAITRQLNAAGDAEESRNVKDGQAYHKLLSDRYSAREIFHFGDRLFIPEINDSLSKEFRLSVAMNWGNQTSRDRVLNDPHTQWTLPQVQAILDTLEERDWEFVQAHWDFLSATYWTEIAEKSERLTGLAPEKVEPLPVVTRFGTYAGGYHPLAYDRSKNLQVGQQEVATEAKLAGAGAYIRTTTNRGHEEARKQHVELPILYSFSVTFKHIDQVIHDLTHHEALIDITRLLRDPKISKAILETRGVAVYEKITGLLSHIAAGTAQPAGGFTFMDQGARWLRSRAQLAGLAANLWSALQQTFGIANGMDRVGVGWVMYGMGRWMVDAATFENTVKWIRDVSPMMAHRSTTGNVDLRQVRAELARPGGWFDKLVRRASGHAITQQHLLDWMMWHINLMQRVADIPTWLGEYSKQMHHNPADEARAIAMADQAVLDSQGGAQIKDLAQVQRGGEVAKLWMTFASYGVTVLNATARNVEKTNFKNPVQVFGFLGHMLLLYGLTSLLTELARCGVGKAKCDDPKKFLQRTGGQALSSAMNGLMYFREGAAAANVALGFDSGGARGYGGPASSRVFETIAGLAQQSNQGVIDDGLKKALWATGGIVLMFPAAQVQRAFDGYDALEEGRTDNPFVMLFGPPPRGQ